MRGCIATGLETAGCAESAAAAEPASRLDRWMTGELDAREDHAVREHLSRCSACAREVAWLRSERALFDERSRFDPSRPPDFAAVMAAFERREPAKSAIAASSRVSAIPAALHRSHGDRRKDAVRPVRRDRSAASMIALGLCAAAALFCVLLPQQSPPVRVAPDVPSTR